MKTYADKLFETYYVSGAELRIRFNIKEVQAPPVSEEPRTQWEADEAVCNVYDDRSTLIEKIIGAVYTPGAELATINNQVDKPERYAEYQAFRVQAKALADGWLAQKTQ